MKNKCKYCNQIIEYEDYHCFGAHVRNCKANPNINEINKKCGRKVSKKDYEFRCKKCRKSYIVNLTLYQYKHKFYRLHCSRKCANSGHIQTEDINNKRIRTILRRIKLGEIIPHSNGGLKGKLNPRYKENGCERVNREIKLKTFDKFKGICQDCGKQLIKKEINTWRAHHNNKHINKKEYYDDEDRTLYCRKCHSSFHNKLRQHNDNFMKFN